MANYDAMLEQKRIRVQKNIDSINKACEELISLNENISYKNISEKTDIPIKTLQNKSYKDCIRNWKSHIEKSEDNIETNIYLEELNYYKRLTQQLRKQNEQLKYELYAKRTK